MNEEENINVNEIIEIDTDNTIYNVAKNINLMLSVLTITIIIIFLYKYLKNCFKRK